MRIIKTDTNQYLMPESQYDVPEITDGKQFIYGWRWHKNEKRWGKQLTDHWFNSFEWIEEVDFLAEIGISKELYEALGKINE